MLELEPSIRRNENIEASRAAAENFSVGQLIPFKVNRCQHLMILEEFNDSRIDARVYEDAQSCSIVISRLSSRNATTRSRGIDG